MADEKLPVENVETAGATAAPVEVSPVVESALGPEIKAETPVAAPVEKTAEPVAEVKAKEKVAEKPAEVKPVEKAVEAPKDEKPAEVKAEEKSPEVKVEQKPAELPKFEALTLPEGVKLEDKQMGEIDSMFGNFEIASKAPHGEIQKLRQAMVEYGLGAVKDAIAETQKQSNTYWETKTKEYREAFDKDPEIGGARKAETTEAARQFISQHAGTPEQIAEVRKLLYDHKLADHPSIIRLLANANLARKEGGPLPAQKAVPIQGKKPWDKMYSNMS